MWMFFPVRCSAVVVLVLNCIELTKVVAEPQMKMIMTLLQHTYKFVNQLFSVVIIE